MFKTGDCVVYGSMGVCRVEKVGVPPSMVSDSVDYYYLKPLYDSGTYYIPVTSSALLRPVMSREQAEDLIASLNSIEVLPSSADARANGQQFRTIIETASVQELARVIKTVAVRQEKTIAQGKKAGEADRKLLEKARYLLHSELSAALDIPLEDMQEYINDKLGE